MKSLNKKFHIDSLFTIEKAADGDGNANESNSVKIVGYANTTTKDRHGDVIIPDAWKQGGVMNYLKNPILLAYHDHSKPVGRVTELTVDDKGLRVTAEVFKAAQDVYEFVKEGVLKAFSIGAAIKDADYNRETDIFVIKDLELLEISIVSVPANQDSLFSLAKGFDSSDFEEFKKQFLPTENEAKGNSEPNGENKGKSKIMEKEELEQLLKGVAQATADAIKTAIPAPAAPVKVEDNTQKLVDEITARFEKRMADNDAANAIKLREVTQGLEGVLKEKSAEMEALMKNKMSFSDRQNQDPVTYQEKETAVLLSKIMGKKIEGTNYGSRVITKGTGAAGPHVSSMANGTDWETEVSNNILEELRRKLIVAPLFRNINMPLSVMRFPVNPEAGYAGWVNKTDYGSTASTGSAQTQGLTDVTLTTYKLATKEFITTEEEEDTVIPLIPIIRDAIVRRMAKAHDKALLRGGTYGTASVTVSASDPLVGVASLGGKTANKVTAAVTGAATVANLIAMRRKLGVWGLDPADLVFIVSNEVYYDLLEDTNFLTVDKIGSDRAVLRTGQIGSVLGIPVILSGEWAAKGANALAACCLYAPNFISGEQRGMTMESEYRIEVQSKLLVATRRLAFQQVTTSNGDGVSSLVWV